MELLVRRANAVGVLRRPAATLQVALYRSKKSRSKDSAKAAAAASGSSPSSPRRSGPSQRPKPRTSSAPRQAASPSKSQEAPPDLEKRWTAMRARSNVVPPPVLPAATKREIENRMRMRRLGLLNDDDDDDYRVEFGGGASGTTTASKDERSQRRSDWQQPPVHPRKYERDATDKPYERPQRRGDWQQPPLHLQKNESAATARPYARRALPERLKQFANIESAPESVVEREFLIPDDPENAKALDVAVIGRPNAGKSSIMNRLLNVTVSAVSAKESHQYVRSLVTTAAETVESVDMTMLVVDAVKRLDEPALDALEKIITTSAQMASPMMLVMNKYDLVADDREHKSLDLRIKDLSQMIEEIYRNHYDRDEASVELNPLAYINEQAFKVSATKGTGIHRLKKTLLSYAVERPWSYHSSMKSDQSDLDLVTEIIREKLFRRYNKELPYSFEQENVGWTKFKDNSVRIDQDIFVPAARIRKMVVGHNGDSIRSVGIAAREEIEALLNRPVHLYLNVRVR
ncbi:hypothetical protein PybrP1_004138 [[Pythium] brassicae (nom. inval.)]|nr:hypothetical protein PybrP1_004138 [[Pythium] brassicae (nom. inval.)]